MFPSPYFAPVYFAPRYYERPATAPPPVIRIKTAPGGNAINPVVSIRIGRTSFKG
jgi:hypothetical protein